MNESTKPKLTQAQQQAKQAVKTIRDTHRSALRSYLRATFQLHRAGRQAADALQSRAEERVFDLVDTIEARQDQRLKAAETRLHHDINRLRKAQEKSQQLRSRFRQQQEDWREKCQVLETRWREEAEVATRVLKAVGNRVERMSLSRD